jgi:hypothetical protein
MGCPACIRIKCNSNVCSRRILLSRRPANELSYYNVNRFPILEYIFCQYHPHTNNFGSISRNFKWPFLWWDSRDRYWGGDHCGAGGCIVLPVWATKDNERSFTELTKRPKLTWERELSLWTYKSNVSVSAFCYPLCALPIWKTAANRRTFRYPFSDHKLPIANINESDGRDRYSGIGLIDSKPSMLMTEVVLTSSFSLRARVSFPPMLRNEGVVLFSSFTSVAKVNMNNTLIIEAGQHNRSNPPDSESYRSRSPALDDRDRELQIPPLNMSSTGIHNPNPPQDYERRYDPINGGYLTPTPRGQLPGEEDEQPARQRDSVLRTGDVPDLRRGANDGPQGANLTRVGVHEMPASSLNPSGLSSFNKLPSRVDNRTGGC